jgi:hypothetical protein
MSKNTHQFSLTLYSSASMRDQVSHPYKKGKTIVLYILLFTFLVADGKTKDSELHCSKHSPNIVMTGRNLINLVSRVR